MLEERKRNWFLTVETGNGSYRALVKSLSKDEKYRSKNKYLWNVNTAAVITIDETTGDVENLVITIKNLTTEVATNTKQS